MYGTTLHYACIPCEKREETLDLFNKYSVCEYIESFYEALHTTGSKYIVNDIDLYIKSKQNAEKEER